MLKYGLKVRELHKITIPGRIVFNEGTPADKVVLPVPFQPKIRFMSLKSVPGDGKLLPSIF